MKRSSAMPSSATRQRSQPGTRPGWMMVELMAMISMTAVIGSCTIVLTSKMLSAQSRFAQSLVEHRTLSMLEQRLREDTRAAERIELTAAEGDEPWQLRLMTGEASVSYTFTATRVERQVGGQLAGRWGDFTGRWALTREPEGKWVRLDLLGEDSLLPAEGRTPETVRTTLRRIELVAQPRRTH